MEQREKTFKMVRIILCAIGFIGIFLPVVTNGALYVNIHHLGGLYLLLYLISVALLVLSIANFYREINYIKIWFISLSALGLVILILGVIAGSNTLRFMSEQFSNMRFMSEFLSDGKTPSSFSNPYPGLGAIFLFINYLGLLIVSFIKRDSANKGESTQTYREE